RCGLYRPSIRYLYLDNRDRGRSSDHVFRGHHWPRRTGHEEAEAGNAVALHPAALHVSRSAVDSVQPNLDNSTHTFTVFSPRLVFRTEFVTHEQIMVQYQYYSYGSWYNHSNNGMASTALPGMAWPGMPYPYGQAGNLWNPVQPDKHTFTIAASMWW